MTLDFWVLLGLLGTIATLMLSLTVLRVLERAEAVKIADRVAAVAAKADEVRQELLRSNVETIERLQHMAAKLDAVHRATNGMREELVAKTEREALARGGREERERADAEHKAHS